MARKRASVTPKRVRKSAAKTTKLRRSARLSAQGQGAGMHTLRTITFEEVLTIALASSATSPASGILLAKILRETVLIKALQSYLQSATVQQQRLLLHKP